MHQGTYLDNYKNMFDLYINNSTCAPTELAGKTGDDSRNEFLDNEAVFYQNGSWEYTNLVGDGKPFTDDDLTMIPSTLAWAMSQPGPVHRHRELLVRKQGSRPGRYRCNSRLHVLVRQL